jgi:hypothetical protein
VRRLSCAALIALSGLLAALAVPGSGAAAVIRCDQSPSLSVQSVPALAGVQLRIGGQHFETNAHGLANVQLASCGLYKLSVSPPPKMPAGTRAHFARWVDDIFTRRRNILIRGSTDVQVGFNIDYRVWERFVDLHGRAVPDSRVSFVLLSNSLGSVQRFAPGKPHWLAGSHVIRRSFGLQTTPILYSVRRVMIGGTNVVREAKDRFYPRWVRHDVKIPLLLYSLHIRARDKLFGFAIGSGLRLTYPNARVRDIPFQDGARTDLASLPRGTYHVAVNAYGLNSTVPIALTRNQDVTLEVVSYLDLVVFFGLLIGGALVLLLLRRPRLRARLHPRVLLRRVARASGGAALLIACLCLLGHVGSAQAAGPQGPQPPRQPVPVLAYYYIWFTHGSWQRAKSDYPLLGRYSSDEVKVMRQHVAWAKSAGINGFIVSWKSTPTLNRRLSRLARVARSQHFKLAVIYEGLDFDREPLPVSRVRADLLHFARTYGSNPVFNVFGKPLVIWSGTWRFSSRDIADVARAIRPRVLLLASEKSRDDYQRISRFVDGDAYYWSSVNPSTYQAFGEKLESMGGAVHQHGGLWIAPAAPGFDARSVGGSSVVPRDHGQTLRTEMDAALQSSPDALGLISWNEFSENSEIEPTVRSGSESLRVLADTLGTKFSSRTDFDSSDPSPSRFGYGSTLAAGFGCIAFTVLLGLLWRKGIRNARRT